MSLILVPAAGAASSPKVLYKQFEKYQNKTVEKGKKDRERARALDRRIEKLKKERMNKTANFNKALETVRLDYEKKVTALEKTLSKQGFRQENADLQR